METPLQESCRKCANLGETYQKRFAIVSEKKRSYLKLVALGFILGDQNEGAWNQMHGTL